MTRPGSGFLIGMVVASGLLWSGLMTAAADQPEPQVVLGFQPEVEAGGTIAISAYLVDPAGNPVVGEEIAFAIASSFLNVDGQMEIGSATTDLDGLALLPYAPRIEGDRVIRAQFTGNDVFASAEASETLLVTPGLRLHEEFSPLRTPGANIWMAAGVLIVVWGVFLFICALIWRIAFLGVNGGVGEGVSSGTPHVVTGAEASDD
ncbi:MAG: hypothetical protein QF554_02380 [Dehalococcoidia bacterium]|nr:hypothetical protein [Dehalococcoidia bacterium]